MTGIDIIKVATRDPGDTRAVEALKGAGHAPEDLLAVVGKTEGNGCVNDFSRSWSASVWEPLLPPEAITVFSGGTEGVISPHVNLIVADPAPHPGFDRGLVAAAGRTRALLPAELGRMEQIEEVRATVAELITGLSIAPDEVHFVLVKCPLLTSDSVSAARREGTEPITDGTYRSMAHSRAASALGIALALGECTRQEAQAALRGETDVWSSRASASAGAELEDCHVLVIGCSDRASNPMRAVHGVMRDAIDITSLNELFAAVRADGGEVVQVFAKAEPDPSGSVRGRRHTMLTDSDIQGSRHARSAVGGLIAGLAGDTAVYVSGGAEHQGPAGGGSITVVYRLPPP
jgi:cyanuric acid amidohydrolase